MHYFVSASKQLYVLNAFLIPILQIGNVETEEERNLALVVGGYLRHKKEGPYLVLYLPWLQVGYDLPRLCPIPCG
jgi:hypothetical protein